MTRPGAASESRLDRMIARLMTQRAHLAWAMAAIGNAPGVIFDIGLGKGRTYTHLAANLPDRDIYSFDRDIHAPLAATPPADRLILGELADTLPDSVVRFAGRVVLLHADIGTESRKSDAAVARLIGAHACALLAPGGVALADRDLVAEGLTAMPPKPADLPDGIASWPYFLYRKP